MRRLAWLRLTTPAYRLGDFVELAEFEPREGPTFVVTYVHPDGELDLVPVGIPLLNAAPLVGYSPSAVEHAR